MCKRFSALAYCLVAAILGLFDATPFVLLLPLPREDAYTGGGLLLLLAVAVVAALLTVKLATRARRMLFAVLFVGAAANVVTAISMRILPSSVGNSMISGALASYWGMDGEYAGIADEYELWSKIWLISIVLLAAVAWSVQHGDKGKVG